MPTRLKDSLGDHVSVNAGESCNLKGALKDTEGNAITSPQTLKITLYDQKSGVVVNSRKDQSVLNENGGVVTSGAYTIELDPDDTAIIGDVKEKETQIRVVRLSFTWNDGDSVRTGIEEFEIPIEQMKETIGVGSGSEQVTITITDTDGSPVPDVEVYVTTDEAGSNVVAGVVMTGANGQTPSIYLDAGTYYRFATREGYSFTNPTEIVVS